MSDCLLGDYLALFCKICPGKAHSALFTTVKQKKVILVTGANKGIGLAIVETLLQQLPEAIMLLGSRDASRG